MSKKDVEVVELNKRNFKGQSYSQLIVQVKGSLINRNIVNCLRRISYKDIPTYALNEQSIDIEFNNTIFNNDYMRLRLAQLPLFDINNDINFLPRKFWENVDYADIKREKFFEDKLNYELYLSAHNDTASNQNITTDALKFYKDGSQIDSPYKNIDPILLIQLKPAQTFKMRGRAVLGVGERADMWAAASNFYYSETKNDSFKVTIESQGQMDEYEILVKACEIAKKKLADIEELIKDKFKGMKLEKNKLVEIILSNEDCTIGNVINDGLQDNPDIVYSGAPEPDRLIKEVIIKFISRNDKVLDPLYDTIKMKIAHFDKLQKEITKVGKKYLNLSL